MEKLNWTRDETILALDLYLRMRESGVSKSKGEIEELSNFLQTLPIHPIYDRPTNFRNRASVSMKMNNFQSLDPAYTVDGRRGFRNRNKIDQFVWDDFIDDEEYLRKVANAIRENSGITAPALDEDESDRGDITEGKLLQRTHWYRERNRSVVKRKKAQAQKRFGRLSCEVCNFTFSEFYDSEIGDGVIDCHHKVPLSEISPGTRTKLSDLALVCSNCHRMLHKGENKKYLALGRLKEIIDSHR